MKKIVAILFALVLILIPMGSVKADSDESRYVIDDAGLLSSSEQHILEDKLSRLSEKYNLDFVVYTTNSTGGVSQEAFVDDFYDYNSYREDGVLLLADMGDRYIYLSTKGEAIDLLTDYGLNLILDDIEDDMSDGNYYKAFSTFADSTEKLIVSGRKGDVIDVEPEEEKKFGAGNVGISAAIAAIASFITTGSMKGKMKSVSRQRYARNYVVRDSFVLTGASDMLVDKQVSRSRISHDNGDRGSHSGGGSSVHVSSSGSTHGGQGRHF